MAKLKLSFLTFLAFFLLYSYVSYTSTTQWAKDFRCDLFEPIKESIIETPDNCYVVFSYDYYHNYLLKIDSNGNFIWFKNYKDGKGLGLYDIQPTSDGGFVLAGKTFENNSVEVAVVKLDSSGNVQWSKIYGGELNDIAYSIQQTQDGGYILAGKSIPNSLQYIINFVIKLDNLGSIQWQKDYRGDIYWWENNFIQKTSDNGYIFLDTKYSNETESEDIWVCKLNSEGNIQWEKTYGGNSSDLANFIIETMDNGYIIAGETYSFGAGEADAWIIKLNSFGDIQWQKVYGGIGYDSAISIKQNLDGSYIIGGSKEWIAWFYKLDLSGNVLWEKIYNDYILGQIDKTFLIKQTSDNGYIAVIKEDFSGDYYRVTVLKTDENGDISGCDFPISSSSIVMEASAIANETITEVFDLNFQEKTNVVSASNPGLGRYKLCFDNTYNLSVTKSGNVTVISNPSGIDCGVLCNDYFDIGVRVVLNATSDPGFYLDYWSFDCVDIGNNQAEVFMNSSKSCFVSFSSCEAKLGDPSENGSISSLDASLVLQNIVGNVEFTQAQKCKADVNGNSAVTSLDASYIL